MRWHADLRDGTQICDRGRYTRNGDLGHVIKDSLLLLLLECDNCEHRPFFSKLMDEAGTHSLLSS